jgi:hypothetical protein
MSIIEEALQSASELREFTCEQTIKQPCACIKNSSKDRLFYASIVLVMALISVITTFALFINTNVASQGPTHPVANKTEIESQKIVKYNQAAIDNQNVYHTIYTIQTGSFVKVERAQKQFDSIASLLNQRELDYLRIEKIGKYYSVRVGNFNDYAIAEKFLQSNERHLSTAVILNAYLKDERIIRSYGT